MAFSAVVALAGGAEVTATAVLAAMAEVGTAMSVVGAVTGNKDLTKLGAVVGLVGGVGGMVSGGAASGLADAATVPTEAAVAGQGALDVGAQSVTDAATGIQSTAAPTLTAGADLTAAPLTNAGVPGVNGFETPTIPAAAPTNVAIPDASLTPPATAAPAPTGAPDAPAGAPVVGAPTDATKGGNFFSQLWSSANNPANKSGINLIGNTLQGIQAADVAQQKQNLANQTLALEQSKFDYTKQLDANLNNQGSSRSGIIQLAKKA
jgi:hypothetical protein